MSDRTWLKGAVRVALIATVFQVAMVVTGHYVPAVASRFGLLGTLISLVAGVAFARTRVMSPGVGLAGGALAGGACAFLGILVSLLLGDVEAAVLLFGTLASGTAGGLGGALAVRRG